MEITLTGSVTKSGDDGMNGTTPSLRHGTSTSDARRALIAQVLGCVLLAAPIAVLAQDNHARAAAVPNTSKSVIIGGEVTRPLTLDAETLAGMSRTRVKAGAHGVEGEWEGVSMTEVLRAAGAPVGENLRGSNLALVVRITAADGYRVVYALAELDPKFRDDAVILADRHDGQRIDPTQGPFRIIAPGEKRPGRWVRQVTRIDVLRLPD